jgi:hypothetical protein
MWSRCIPKRANRRTIDLSRAVMNMRGLVILANLGCSLSQPHSGFEHGKRGRHALLMRMKCVSHMELSPKEKLEEGCGCRPGSKRKRKRKES